MSILENLISEMWKADSVAKMQQVIDGQNPQMVYAALQNGRFYNAAPEKYLLVAGTKFKLGSIGCDISREVHQLAERILRDVEDLGDTYPTEVLDLAVKF